LYDSFFSQLAAIQPRLVIVSLGTNDAYSVAFNVVEFENNLCTFITKLKTALPGVSVIFTTPPDCYRNKKYTIQNLQVVRDIIVRECLINNFAYWDFYNIMGGFGSMQKWFLKGYTAKDKVHFTRRAYEIQGSLLLHAILKSYNDYAKQ
jgi:lysophospholipase L1-like esterase